MGLLQEVTRKEEGKEKQEGTIDDETLLPRRQRVPTQPKLLVLGKPSHFHTLALEVALGCTTCGTPPIRREVGEICTCVDWVCVVSLSLLVHVPT